MEIIFLLIIILGAIYILWRVNVGEKTNRNAVDVMFFNTTLAIVILFMIGILNPDHWKEIVYALSAVAIGTGIAGVFKR